MQKSQKNGGFAQKRATIPTMQPMLGDDVEHGQPIPSLQPRRPLKDQDNKRAPRAHQD